MSIQQIPSSARGRAFAKAGRRNGKLEIGLFHLTGHRDQDPKHHKRPGRRNPVKRQTARPGYGQAVKDTGTGTKNTIKRAANDKPPSIAKTAPRTAKTAIKTADHAAKTAQATARTARATAQAARVTAKATATTAKAAAKGASVAAKALLASVKALVTAIAAGGWVAILALVVICLIGLIVASPFGIFFSRRTAAGQTMPTVPGIVRPGKLGEMGSAGNRLERKPAVWPEVLAVYAVKTTTDPDDPQEVATMDDGKKELLKEIFWAMNEISHRTETATTTQTVETDDGKGNIMVDEVEVTATTLYITVTHKTVDEMADIYNFTADQREMLVELLAEESNGMWSAVLYGIGTGDREIVTVALSQLGNVGGRPYWSWYGFESRVDWCACFVSWCANECGYLDTGVIPRFASCSIGIQWFRERGLWQDRSYEPRPAT
ncbi:MAG: CHAP domain-containing protein [Flavonifractor plautii]